KILSNFLLLRYLKKIFYNSVAELRLIKQQQQQQKKKKLLLPMHFHHPKQHPLPSNPGIR
ncbi:hypothetical protein, partial [Bacteroides uniformis]|uniref:hypothetical protein n=1 Tax=Bacteroides uniformis TaxID=820 RepID=UPI00321B4A7F